MRYLGMWVLLHSCSGLCPSVGGAWEQKPAALNPADWDDPQYRTGLCSVCWQLSSHSDAAWTLPILLNDHFRLYKYIFRIICAYRVNFTAEWRKTENLNSAMLWKRPEWRQRRRNQVSFSRIQFFCLNSAWCVWELWYCEENKQKKKEIYQNFSAERWKLQVPADPQSEHHVKVVCQQGRSQDFRKPQGCPWGAAHGGLLLLN